MAKNGRMRLSSTSTPSNSIRSLQVGLIKLTMLCPHSAIQHECIVGVVGVCTKPPALVLEYMPRGSLFDAIHREQLDRYKYSWKLFLKIATDVADGPHCLT